jgi:hypothetical protein
MSDVVTQSKGFEVTLRRTFVVARLLTPPWTVDAEAIRSAKNISLWRSYLSHECVEAMVQMGWHHTT